MEPNSTGKMLKLIVLALSYIFLVLHDPIQVGAQTSFEPPATLSASKILPPDLLSGPNHRVEERVYNDGYLNTYRIGSKFGTFVAVSTPMLRKCIGEINALVRMEQIEGTKEFTSALKEAGTDALVGFKNHLNRLEPKSRLLAFCRPNKPAKNRTNCTGHPTSDNSGRS